MVNRGPVSLTTSSAPIKNLSHGARIRASWYHALLGVRMIHRMVSSHTADEGDRIGGDTDPAQQLPLDSESSYAPVLPPTGNAVVNAPALVPLAHHDSPNAPGAKPTVTDEPSAPAHHGSPNARGSQPPTDTNMPSAPTAQPPPAHHGSPSAPASQTEHDAAAVRSFAAALSPLAVAEATLQHVAGVIIAVSFCVVPGALHGGAGRAAAALAALSCLAVPFEVLGVVSLSRRARRVEGRVAIDCV